ncbi:MAG TPA: DUF2784 domain-containing protein [Verrucomicrobiae bacterium]|nr:DUF2784 domain-containing protein [Verrucomicrobiae bacterium]
MLRFLDVLLTLVHLALVFFNLFGWIPKRTRKAHLITLLITAASWFILGIWYGMGYCPLTDWQWNVKEKLGERNLPPNFIEYYAEKLTGRDYAPAFIGGMITVFFALAAGLSLYVNFVHPRIRRKLKRG